MALGFGDVARAVDEFSILINRPIKATVKKAQLGARACDVLAHLRETDASLDTRRRSHREDAETQQIS